MKRNYTVPATVAAVLGVIGFTVGSLSANDGGRATEDSGLVPAAEQTTTGDPADPCTLVTKAEAADALGTEVTAVPDPNQCTYVAMDASARALAVSAPDMASGEGEFQAGVDQAAQALNGTYREVSAGEEAYSIHSSVVAEGLARTGDGFVVVVLTNATGTADAQSQLLDGLLQAALGRL